MPIRITCPSCSATLSVKDEFAGRAVKCPKCAGIIPPQQAPATASEPEAVAALPPPPAPPEPKKAPAEPSDEPEKPAKTGSKITGKPSPRSESDDRDEDDRPRKRRDEDERDDERSRDRDERERRDEDDRPRRRRDDDDDDRPRRRRRRDDDDDDDRPARNRRQQQGGSGVGLVLALVAGSLLVCCGGVGYGVYWFTNRVKQEVEKAAEDLKKADAAAPKKVEDLSGPAVASTAAEIATAYKDNKAAADTKYKDKVVTVEGALDAIDLMPDGTMYARLVGIGSVGMAGNVQPRCVVQAGETNKVFNCSRGQTIKFRGRCAGLSGPFVDVMSAKVESTGPDPSVTVSVATYLADYARDEKAADEKYKDKQITLTGASVESKTGAAIYLVSSSKTAKTALKIKVAIAGDFRKQFENLKPGDRVAKIKGEGSGKFDNEVYLNRAWIVP